MHPDSELLALWERGAAAPAGWRDDALLGLAGKAPASLGARNAALLALRARLLGPEQPLVDVCPECGVPVEFAVDCAALAVDLAPPPQADEFQNLTAHGYTLEFRLPTADDLRAAAARDDFVPVLLSRCVSHCVRDDGSACAPHDLPDAVALALSARMEALEPGASVGFDLACPACGAHWAAQLDVGAVIWAEIQTRAERVLLDVDLLARTYGWNEAEVLALSPVRRAAYLQLAGAV